LQIVKNLVFVGRTLAYVHFSHDPLFGTTTSATSADEQEAEQEGEAASAVEFAKVQEVPSEEAPNADVLGDSDTDGETDDAESDDDESDTADETDATSQVGWCSFLRCFYAHGQTQEHSGLIFLFKNVNFICRFEMQRYRRVCNPSIR
jgi:hypothetical protein